MPFPYLKLQVKVRSRWWDLIKVNRETVWISWTSRSMLVDKKEVEGVRLV